MSAAPDGPPDLLEEFKQRLLHDIREAWWRRHKPRLGSPAPTSPPYPRDEETIAKMKAALPPAKGR